MKDNYEVYIEVRSPLGKRLAQTLTFADPYIKAFQPLPVNRELYWEIQAQEEAKKQQELRKQCVQIITSNIISLLESQDTYNGYPPQ